MGRKCDKEICKALGIKPKPNKKKGNKRKSTKNPR